MLELHTAGPELTLFQSCEEEEDILRGVPLNMPRYVWSNTTTRTLSDELLRRLTRIVETVPALNAGTHASWKDVLAKLCLALQDGSSHPFTEEVLTKILLTCERWGLLKINKTATGSDRWVLTYDAAEALLTDPDQFGVLAALLLQQPFSEEHPHRHNVGMLRFIAACADAGFAAVRADEIAFLAATRPKEGPWSSEVKALAKLRNTQSASNLSLADWERVATNVDEVKSVVASTVAAMLQAAPKNTSDAERLLRTHSKKLFPAVRETRLDKLVDRLVPLVLQGDGEQVRSAVWEEVLTKAVETHCDYVSAALKLLSSVGLLDMHTGEKNPMYSARYSINDFGLSALQEFPASRAPKTYRDACAAQRSTDASPFPNRSRERAERLREKFVGDARYEGRAYLAANIDWAEFSGSGRAHEFEWNVVRSVLAVTPTATDFDPVSGVHTKLNHALDAVHHAPGGNADAWLRTAHGRRLLIEVTGVSGAEQVSHELEPVVRHLRNAAREEPSAAAVFIAPGISQDMVAYLLCAAAGDPETTVPPAPVIPLTTTQLGALLRAGAIFHDLVEVLIPEISKAAAVPTLQSARVLLETIAHAVAAAAPQAAEAPHA